MSASRSGTVADIDVDPDAAARRHLGRRRRESRGAKVLKRDEEALVEELKAALDQLRLLERVADLHRGALRLVGLVELGGREDRRAADPVAAGGSAHQDDLVADAGGRRRTIASVLREADAHRVHQAVLLVRRLEVDLAADRWDADRVAVVADAGDDVVEEVARALRGEVAEPKRVEDRDRPGAQREDVAQDPADAGRRALERLDRRRVVVRLDLERDRVAAADVHRARVLARAHHDARPLGRQAA